MRALAPKAKKRPAPSKRRINRLIREVRALAADIEDGADPKAVARAAEVMTEGFGKEAA